jgi:hypothetical protein
MDKVQKHNSFNITALDDDDDDDDDDNDVKRYVERLWGPPSLLSNGYQVLFP